MLKKNNFWNWLNKNKHFFVSIISFLILLQFISWTTHDYVTDWKPKYETNNSINYDALRNNFPPYVFFFMTTQVIIMLSLSGTFYCFYKNNFFKTIFFCSVSYMVFNIFGLTRFKWDSFSKDPYNAYKTFASHFEFPILSFLMLLWLRKGLFLNWKAMFIFSFYLTFFYISVMIIYYSITFTNEFNEKEHLKMYEFLDFNVKVMCFPTNNLGLRIFFNTGLILITPITGLFIFIGFKIIFNVKIERYVFKKELAF